MKIVSIKGSWLNSYVIAAFIKITVMLMAFTFNAYTSFSRNVIDQDTITNVTKPALPPNGDSYSK